MRLLLREIRKRIFRSSGGTRKSGVCFFNNIHPCMSCVFADNKDHRFPEKGWRLIAHINCTNTTAKTEPALDIELNEELQERVDFLACLFGDRKRY